MRLTWFSRSRRSPDVETLVARGKYDRAVEALRSELRKRQATAEDRLRFADLLALAGRGQEAVPILLALAEEHARHGFRERALKALRRVDAIDPGRDDVRARFETLSRATRPIVRASSSARAASFEEVFTEETNLRGTPASDVGGAFEIVEGTTEDDAVLEAVVVDLGLQGDSAVGSTAAGAAVAAAAASGATPGSLADAHEDELVVVEERTNPVGYPPVVFAGAAADGGGARAAPRDEGQALLDFVRGLGRRPAGRGRGALAEELFSDLEEEELEAVAPGLRRLACAAGDVIVSEGSPGSSIFLLVEGTVRVVVFTGYGRPFEIRQLEAPDFFGEVAALTGRRRTATVVAASDCVLLEVDRPALDRLVGCRHYARLLVEDACVGRAQSAEESAVRALTREEACPERAAAALASHFGEGEWAPRVRLQLARLLLGAGREGDGLAVLAGVAEELAAHGDAASALALLKQVQRLRRRSERELRLAPLRREGDASDGTDAHPVAADPAGAAPATPNAEIRPTTRVAFRDWVRTLLAQTDALAAAGAPPGLEEEAADDQRDREPGGLPDEATQARGHRSGRAARRDQSGHQHAG